MPQIPDKPIEPVHIFHLVAEDPSPDVMVYLAYYQVDQDMGSQRVVVQLLA